MRALTERRRLHMGCGESLRHRPERVFGVGSDRSGAPPRSAAEPAAQPDQGLGQGPDQGGRPWSRAPDAEAPDSADIGKCE